MIRNDYRSNQLLIWACILTMIVSYQNCGGTFDFGAIDATNLEFREPDRTEDPNGPQATDTPTEEPPGSGSIEESFIEFDLKLNPQTTEYRPDVHVTTILDNSYSMKPIQQDVKSAFQNVSKIFKGFNGSMSLYTTTQDESGSLPSFKKDHQISYMDFLGLEYLIDTSEFYLIPEETPYKLITSYSLSSPFGASSELVFRDSMNDTEFDDFTASYANSIDQLDTDGSDQEQGLCTLYRAIQDSKERYPDSFHVYILAANEDDVTSPETCPAQSLQEVLKTRVSEESETECTVGDPSCEHNYKLSYAAHYDKSLAYKFRKISEEYNYTLNRKNVSNALSYKFRFHRQRIRYKIKQHLATLSFERYIERDNLIIPKGVLEEKNYSQGDGACSALSRSCSQNEIDSLGLEHGVVSCAYSCAESDPTNFKYTSYENQGGGTCSGDGIAVSQSCTSAQKTKVLNGLSSNSLGQCDYLCEDASSGQKTLTLTAPTTCSDLSRSCSSNEYSKAISADGWAHLETSDFVNCSYSCSESNQSGSLTYNNKIFRCDGVASGASGKTSLTCTDSQKKSVASSLSTSSSTISPTDLTSCTYTCSQTVSSRKKSLESPSQCKNSSSWPLACSTQNGGFTKAASLQNVDPGFIVQDSSCSYSCDEQTPINPCNVSLSGGNFCDAQKFPNEYNSLVAQCQLDGYELNLGSENFCSVSSVSKLTTNYHYVEDTQEILNKSFYDDEDVVGSLKQNLEDSHGSNFYAGFFVYPVNDSSCSPITGLSEGARYVELAEQIGNPNRSGSFPLCLEDYSEKLGFIFNLVSESILRSYLLDIQEDDQVVSVRIVRGTGSTDTIDPTNYSLDGKILTFSSEQILQDSTEIIVKIKRPVTVEEN